MAARPRRARAPSRPEPGMSTRIVAEATRLFSARGFDGTALQDIADAVGVTKPAILHHFQSKELVLQAVLDAIVRHWEGTLPRLLLEATAGERRFDAVIGEVVRFFADDADRTRVVLRHALDRPAEARALIRDKVRLWMGAVASYVRRGRERGLHPPDVDEDAYVLLVLQLIIATTATFPVLREALPGTPAEGLARVEAEAVRIARAALFTPAGAVGAGRDASPLARR